MAKFNPGIQGIISGSTGGITFANTPYGNVMKMKSIPPNKWSEAKDESKYRLGSASSLWSEVTPAQAREWDKFAKGFTRIDRSGNKVRCRTVDLFKSINRYMIEINEPFILSAPKKVFPKKLKSVEIEITASDKLNDIRVYFSPPIDKNTKIIVYASGILKRGVNSTKKNFYKKIGVIDSTFHSGSSILNNYLSVFSAEILKSDKIAFRFKPVCKISGLKAAPVSLIEMAF